jgi:D-alanyl-D-alanine carboxypeptidase/D-alanyl-D-alanine-endopeptidase (penicillin-binding protein 4)
VAGASDQVAIGLLAVSLDRGDTLVALHPGLRLIPGSVAKLLTTSAFLSRFGTADRRTTRIEARGHVQGDPVAGVRLKGELFLRGSGAPDVTQLLAAGSRGLLDSLAVLLHAGGLRRFEGTLWVDGTLFAPEPYAASWALEDVPYAYGAPVNAILANGNAATLIATGGPKGVSFSFEPPEVPLTIEGSVRVAGAGQPGWVEVDRRPFDPRLRVRGEVPRDGSVRKQISVPDPDSTAGLMLLGAMRRAGTEVKDGRVRVVPHAGTTGAGTTGAGVGSSSGSGASAAVPETGKASGRGASGGPAVRGGNRNRYARRCARRWLRSLPAEPSHGSLARPSALA